MTTEVTLTIAPNEKYREVVWGEPSRGTPETEAEYLQEATHHEATEAYLEVIEDAPVAEDYDADVPPDPLSWSDISVSNDADLVAKMTTYFQGMDPTEPSDRLRAKLRLVDADVYANAQIAAQAELRT